MLWIVRHRRHFGDSSEPSRRARLYVDVSVISREDAGTGIQRVVRAFWLGLLRNSGPFDLVPVAATSRHGYQVVSLDMLENSLPHAMKVGDIVSGKAGDAFLGLDLAGHVLPFYATQLSSWRRSGVAIHIFVYDILPLTTPQFFGSKTVRNFRRWFRSISRLADQLICISTPVAEEVARMLRMQGRETRPAIVTIPLGADIHATLPTTGYPPGGDAFLAGMAHAPTILMVGTVEPRKGYDIALDAFDSLWAGDDQTGISLVIVGRPGWKTAALQARMRTHPELGRRFQWFDNASDEFLEALYGRCRGLLVTSHAEGFGLPLREAIHHGRPVLARDLAVFRVDGPSGVAYFADDDPEMLAGRIRDWAHDDGEKEKLGVSSASCAPTWEQCTFSLLERLVALTPENLGQARSPRG